MTKPSDNRAGASKKRTTERAGEGPASGGYGGGVVDRRVGLDRRAGKPAPSGLERRRGPGRRLSDFQRAAEAGEMTGEQFLFLSAINAFKQANGQHFPSWSDVLEVIRLLGYRKTMASELNLQNAEDWKEAPNTASGVRPDGWERRFSEEERREIAGGDAEKGPKSEDAEGEDADLLKAIDELLDLDDAA